MASMLLLFYIGAAVASTSHTLVSAAIGWPILDDELGPAFGSTPPALLAAGLQSLCFAQLAIVDGELEDARSAAARFCTAARDPTLRAAMRCWAMATIVVLDTPVTPCESRVAAVLAQRVRLHRVSGGLGDVAASFRVFTAARWHSAAQILSAARAFCNCEGTFLANDATIALRNAEAASIAWAERGSSISSNRREGAPRSAACAATIYVLPLKDEQTIAREVAMIFEGLRALGCVTTRSIEDATWIFDIPSEHEESPRVIRPPELEAKVVTIDVHDTPSLVSSRRRGSVYFKRSYAYRSNGTTTSRRRRTAEEEEEEEEAPSRLLPLSFGILDRYLGKLPPLAHAARPFSVACLLRPHSSLHYDESRDRILRWTTSALMKWGLMSMALIGQVTDKGRSTVDHTYFACLRQSRIVVTSHPSEWEGDHRTYEALASGALVVLDSIGTPTTTSPLRDGVHLVVFDSHDHNAFDAKLRYYIDHPHQTEAIARRGCAFALAHHRAEHRVAYILEELDRTVKRKSIH